VIEVNLLPGGKKRPARGKVPSFSFALPTIGGLPQDRWVLGAIAAGVVAVLAMGWMFLSVGSRRGDAEVALEQVAQDSARYADLISRTNALLARRDSIVQKVSIIQEIDQGRYVWPHILDEVARALPDYTWVTQVQQVTAGPEPRLRVAGQAGNNFALAVFMEQLEASPFLRDVRIITSQQAIAGEQLSRQLVYAYDLEVSFEQPPMEFLETVPLLGPEPGEMAADTTGAAVPAVAQ